MATSFSAAALGAEGLAADVTMLVGNGYTPGHAELALDLVRSEPAVRRLFERRLVASEHARDPEEARPRPGHRAPGPQPRPQGRAPDRASWPSSTPPSRWSGPTLRLAGLSGADPDGTPVGQPARRRRPRGRRARARPGAAGLGRAAARGGRGPRHARPEGRRPARSGSACPRAATPQRARTASRKQVGAGVRRIDARRRERERLVRTIGDAPRQPWIYLIVATGDIYEDIPQAQQAAREGADVIAVIRSTGQSLLDYVPEGATREGFAGTYATQENFRLMRAALDDVEPRAGPLRAADQLRLRPVHAGDRGAGRARAARHDAQRLDVRDPLPRHQPGAHLRRPALQPPGARPRRDHHQHRRGQLPDHRRRRRGRAHGHRPASCSTSTSPRRPGSRTGSSASGHAFEIDPDLPGLVPAGAGPRAAGPRAVPRGAAEVDAADQAHDRRRLPRLPARRVLQPRRGADRPGHPAGRDDDRGRGHARGSPTATWRCRTCATCWRPPAPCTRTSARAPDGFIADRARHGAGRVDRPARPDRRARPTACSTPSPTARSA